MTARATGRLVGPLERSLLEQYYGVPIDPAQASSHWQTLARDFGVVLDTTGRLELRGAGFGTCHWNGPVHQLFDNATRLVHLAILEQGADLRARSAAARPLVARAGLDFTFDVFRQVCTAAFLVPRVTMPSPRFLLIGDGYGVLGGLLRQAIPAAQITYVDLGQTLLFQSHYMQGMHPEATHVMVDQNPGWQTATFAYCPSERAEQLAEVRFDVAVNVASMQEMAPAVVARYFDLMRRTLRPANLFYCCNREEKVMPGGEVSRFADYPWAGGDRILIDGPCPWHQFMLSPKVVGRVGNLPVPFVQRYDGPHRHRLAVMEVR